MQPIRIDNGVVVYYGNRVGRVTDGRAVVDSMFKGEELNDFLENQREIREIKWTEGMFDRMIGGSEKTSEMQALKDCRVWQLKSDVDIHMKFIGYDDFCRKFGTPYQEDYQKVYDGAVDTNDLESLYTKFNMDHPAGYTGHSLSMSDVLELYDESGSEFYYVDRIGFKPISFEEKEPELMEDDPMLKFYRLIDREYAAYIKQMESQPQAKLIQMAAELTAMKEIYQALRNNPYLPCDYAENLSRQKYPLEEIRKSLPTRQIIPEQAILDACKKTGEAILYEVQEETAWKAAPVQTMQL